MGYNLYVKPALEASAGGVHQIFVYGTLKNGEANHGVLGKNRILKGHSRATGYLMVDLGAFPGAVKVLNGGWHIYGEVYEVDDNTFKEVDRLEGHPDFYRREVCDLEYFGKSWIYTLPRERYLQNGCRFIPCGRWNKSAQAYVFNEDRLSPQYDINRPLVPAISYNRESRGVIVPESSVRASCGAEKPPEEEERKETCIVGPGWEEA